MVATLYQKLTLLMSETNVRPTTLCVWVPFSKCRTYIDLTQLESEY